MDASYAITHVFAELEARGIEAVIPARAERPPKAGTIPVRRFKLDGRNKVARCPARKLLRPHAGAGAPDLRHGHPIHVKGDPGVVTLRELSRAQGFYGKHWRLMEALAAALNAGDPKLPMNAVAAIGAIVADMGLEPLMSRGLMLTAEVAGITAARPQSPGATRQAPYLRRPGCRCRPAT